MCKRLPEPNTGLKGFKVGQSYEGRAFNGLFEINPQWGSGQESKLISKSLFNEFLKESLHDELVKTSA